MIRQQLKWKQFALENNLRLHEAVSAHVLIEEQQKLHCRSGGLVGLREQQQHVTVELDQPKQQL
jgi:hypothetical protein